MYIHKIVETPEGSVEFEGEFSPEEVSFLMEFALTALVRQGLLPLVVKNKEEMSSVIPVASEAIN
jgi:hypothetical protein